MYGAEAAGLGVDTEHHAATLTKGRPGVLHGSSWMCSKMPMVKFLKPFLSQQVGLSLVSVQNIPTTMILNVPAMSCNRRRSLGRDSNPCLVEGIIPALESSHAIAFAVKLTKNLTRQVYDCLSIRSWGQGCGSSQGPLESRCSKEGRSSCLRH